MRCASLLGCPLLRKAKKKKNHESCVPLLVPHILLTFAPVTLSGPSGSGHFRFLRRLSEKTWPAHKGSAVRAEQRNWVQRG